MTFTIEIPAELENEIATWCVVQKAKGQPVPEKDSEAIAWAAPQCLEVAMNLEARRENEEATANTVNRFHNASIAEKFALMFPERSA